MSPTGNGFSETCTDADTNGICDSTYTVPGANGSVDNNPRTQCTLLPLPSLAVVKSQSVISDPVNGTTNPKAIPGAIIRYTVIITNGMGAAVGRADRVDISDDLDTEITTNGTVTWETDSMIVTAPLVNSGAPKSLTDAADADEGEFNDTVGNREVLVDCSDLEPGQSCRLTFEVEVQ